MSISNGTARAPPPLSTRVQRLSKITKFTLSTFAKSQLLAKKAETPQRVGLWIAEEAIELGPLFTKLIQLASTRSDVLDPELIEAMSIVQDEVRFDGVVKPEVGGYAVEGDSPLKSGSVASVWTAVRESDGKRVVIKKLHDGVRASFETDLPTLVGVLRAASAAKIPGADNFYDIVRESVDMLLRETDLTLEAASMAAFKERAPDGIVVPEVVEYTSDYIVQEYVYSRKISAVRGPNPALARRMMLLFATSILEIGIVHADPHPGNVGVTADGKLVLYDFGASVEVSRLRGSIGKLVTCLASRDLEGFVDSMQKIGIIATGRDSDMYRVVRILEKLVDLPPSDFHVSLSQQPEFSDSGGGRLIRFNPETVYLLRALSMTEGICRKLDPDFSYETYWTEDLRRVFEENVDVELDAGSLAKSWLVSAAAVPSNQRKTLDVLQQINFELRDEIKSTRDLINNAAIAAIAYAVISNFL